MHFPPPGYVMDRASDAPIVVEVGSGAMHHGTGPVQVRNNRTTGSVSRRVKVSPSWVGMSGYLAAGILLGLVLILALSFGRGDAAASQQPGLSPNAVTDNVVRLHARDIGTPCWAGYDKLGPARLTIALEIGLDGRVRHAAASGETPAMRACVEAHVRTWEFLPQTQPQQLALPFEVDRR
jgi:hypothetical protein